MSLDWAAIEIFGHDGRGKPRMREDRFTGRMVYDFNIKNDPKNKYVEIRVPQRLATHPTFNQMVRAAEKQGRTVRVFVYHE